MALPPAPSHAVPAEEATLAVLVVNYQTAEEIGRLVNSLFSFPPVVPWHLVLIDNASPDGSGQWLEEAYGGKSWATVRRLPDNVGFGAANTQVAADLPTPVLCFLNPDCVIEQDNLTAAVEHLHATPDCGVVGVRIYRGTGELEPSARAFPDPWAGLAGRKSVLRKVWPNNPLSRRFLVADRAGEGVLRTDWVAGTCMLVRRDEFLALGGFDPRYFMYWEDCDLCWRYRKGRGQYTDYLPVGRIVHAGDGSARKARPQAVRYFHRAAYQLVKTHIAPQPWHPLRWFAWAALGLRARLLLARSR